MIRIQMFKSRQVRLLAAALTALCALLAGASTALAGTAPATSASLSRDAAAQAHTRTMTGAQAISPLFTCPGRHICLYPSDTFTGNYPGGQPIVLDPAGTTSGVWFSFDSIGAGSPHPGSIYDNSGSSIWLYDAQEPVAPHVNPVCLASGARVDVDHAFGYFEIFYGDPDCSNNYTRPLP